jgi:WD40 repeat protein
MWSIRFPVVAVAVLVVASWEPPVPTLSAQSNELMSAGFVALSRDGRLAATSHMALRGSKIVPVITVHELTNGSALQQITVSGDTIVALHLSGDGKHVLAVSGPLLKLDSFETAQIFNAATGEEEARWESHNTNGHWCQFTNDGRSVVVAGMDSSLILWDVEGKKQIRAFRGSHASINALSVSDDDTYLIAAGDDERARVWRIQTGELVQTLTVKKGRVLSVSIARGNGYAVTGSVKRSLAVWQLPSGKQLLDFEIQSAVWSAVWSPDNAFLAIGAERELSLLSLKDGAKKWTKPTESAVKELAFSSDSRFIGSRDGGCHVYEADTGQRVTPSQGTSFSAVQFDPFKPLMLYASERGEFLIDLTTNKRMLALSTLKSPGPK